MDWTESVERYVHTLGKGTARQYRAGLEDFSDGTGRPAPRIRTRGF